MAGRRASPVAPAGAKPAGEDTDRGGYGTHVNAQRMTLRSDSFAHGESLPVNHTADGADLAPGLSWSGTPPGTRSLALVVEDPDAPDPISPQRTFTHWIVYDIPPSASRLALAADKTGLPPGASQGRNDFGRLCYAGPNPTIGRHRYIFRLFALDTTLRMLIRPERGELFEAMQGHILAEAEIMGTYERAGGRQPSVTPSWPLS